MTTEVSERRHEDGRLERTADQPWYQAAAGGGPSLLFVLTAMLALRLGMGQRREQTDHRGAVEEVAQKPFWTGLLLVLAVGLLRFFPSLRTARLTTPRCAIRTVPQRAVLRTFP